MLTKHDRENLGIVTQHWSDDMLRIHRDAARALADEQEQLGINNEEALKDEGAYATVLIAREQEKERDESRRIYGMDKIRLTDLLKEVVKRLDDPKERDRITFLQYRLMSKIADTHKELEEGR